MNDFLKQINPKLKQNKDKRFSQQIYNFCKKKGGRMRVFKQVSEGFNKGSILLGYLSEYDITGSYLHNIRRGKYEMYAFMPSFKVEDITEEFWGKYTEFGLCYLDKHYGGGDYMIEVDKNRKVCKFCGCEMVKKTKEIIKIKEWYEEVKKNV